MALYADLAVFANALEEHYECIKRGYEQSMLRVMNELTFVNTADIAYRDDPNDQTVCYVVGVASSGKIWCFLFLFLFLRLSRGLSSSVFAVFFALNLKWVILDYIAHSPII